MTKIVRQGANRAAYNARTARHAQRTPLPPRGTKPQERGSVRIARELAAEMKEGR